MPGPFGLRLGESVRFKSNEFGLSASVSAQDVRSQRNNQDEIDWQIGTHKTTPAATGVNISWRAATDRPGTYLQANRLRFAAIET
jgi:hypothetical protein